MPNLMFCPDCGKEISRRAQSCIHCGCPISEILKTKSAQPTTTIPEPFTTIPEPFQNQNQPKIQTDASSSAEPRHTETQAYDQLSPLTAYTYARNAINGFLQTQNSAWKITRFPNHITAHKGEPGSQKFVYVRANISSLSHYGGAKITIICGGNSLTSEQAKKYTDTIRGLLNNQTSVVRRTEAKTKNQYSAENIHPGLAAVVIIASVIFFIIAFSDVKPDRSSANNTSTSSSSQPRGYSGPPECDYWNDNWTQLECIHYWKTLQTTCDVNDYTIKMGCSQFPYHPTY